MKQLLTVLICTITLHVSAQETDYHFSHTDTTTLSPQKIWEVWTDVPNWRQWDKGLKEAQLFGEFVANSKGKLIPVKGPKSKFKITEVEQYKSYTFQTKIPLGWLAINRTLKTEKNITYFTHDVEFNGPLKKIFGNKLGKNYRRMLPEVMLEIKHLAKNR